MVQNEIISNKKTKKTNIEILKKSLYKNMVDPDILIRTGGHKD